MSVKPEVVRATMPLDVSHLSASEAPLIVGVRDATRMGNPDIDGLLSGWHWPATATIAYGFPTSTDPYPSGDLYVSNEMLHGFAPASTMMQQAFDSFVLGLRSTDAPSMTLTPVTGFTNLRLLRAVSSEPSTNILVAHSSDPSTAWGYYPGDKYGVREGDIWLGPNYREYVTPTVGSYGYMIAMHEFGHALGLKHPFSLEGDESTSLPFDKDFSEYTLMSYNRGPFVTPADLDTAATAGPDAGVATFHYNYPQTYMMLDIAALQHMYGANYTFRSSDTIYRWNPETGEVYVNGIPQGQAGNGLVSAPVANYIFETIWDGGGIDTYDLSNYSTNLKLDLRPGGYSVFDPAQCPSLGSFPNPTPYRARGNVYNALLHDGDPRSLIENARGGSGNDTINGNATRNHLWGGDGNDTMNGGAGEDVLAGGHGKDRLIGGEGRDRFVFDTAPKGSNVDRIFGFEPQSDQIALENHVFRKLGRAGELKASAFWSGSHAHDRSDRIIYNAKTGALSYDPDGSGHAAAQLVAKLDKHLVLHSSDFMVI